MSFFKKAFASIGIGSAKIDTRLVKDSYAPGEEVVGEVEIRGGSTEQQIADIYLSLHTTYIKERDDKKYTATAEIGRFRLADSFIIQPDERRVVPFSFVLPADTPLSLGRTKVWVAAGLDIQNAVDPTDKDIIHVVPNRLMAEVIKSVGELGFKLREADCQEARRLRTRLPIIQEFEFIPVTGPYRGRLDELELVFLPGNGAMEILLQVDRRARGLGGFLAEALEMDETKVKLTVSDADILHLKDKINSTIQRYS
ncbi:sporulation protein SpoOM [Bacillus sp. V3-13]|uniref:sporulation protein n=1 Tax=Bacillus sp. V3-13 TaxID=2053728 RepID=UPI000C777B9B|nr:sporulation protein [Bacillus sp. V3-13]PLR77272.1 sporulation protein SpoOM [Bacillus sp. V3-13]